ncbi:MAG: hypothetical protein ACKO6K_01295, partial [Chitinophagaceae bacterium]
MEKCVALRQVVKHQMKPICWMILLIGVNMTSSVAQPYFVAIDNEMAAAFTVQWGDRSFYSDSNGRVVLSGLEPGTIDLWVKFDHRVFPDHQFRVPVQSDRQFQLRVLEGRVVG